MAGAGAGAAAAARAQHARQQQAVPADQPFRGPCCWVGLGRTTRVPAPGWKCAHVLVFCEDRKHVTAPFLFHMLTQTNTKLPLRFLPRPLQALLSSTQRVTQHKPINHHAQARCCCSPAAATRGCVWRRCSGACSWGPPSTGCAARAGTPPRCSGCGAARRRGWLQVRGGYERPR